MKKELNEREINYLISELDWSDLCDYSPFKLIRQIEGYEMNEEQVPTEFYRRLIINYMKDEDNKEEVLDLLEEIR